jgi:hypothetical protein
MNSKHPFFLCNTCHLLKFPSFATSTLPLIPSSDQFYFDDSQISPDHGPDCLGHMVVIPQTYSDILPHSRDLVSHLNASFYCADEYALISHWNYIMQSLAPRYNVVSQISQISQSAFFSRIWICMRSIFLKQNAWRHCCQDGGVDNSWIESLA